MTTSEQALQKPEESMSHRFMLKVVSEFTGGVGELALTEFQKRLAQNYFIAVDAALSSAEEKRKKKTRNKDPLPVTWANVDLAQLARSVVAAARIGIDPGQENHVAIVPFKNNTTNKYEISLIEGYRGIELKGKKYGLDVPDHVIVELVYSTDKFKSIKKDRNNIYESFEFEIGNEFDRGDIVGGFYYHVYTENPEKNKLVVMSLKDILKRKPKYASVEFWGGEKDIWEDGKKVGKEHSDGWFEKMAYKTVYRAAYRDITIDSQKIDDDYMRLKQLEQSYAESEAAREIAEEANMEIIDIELVEDDPSQDPPAPLPPSDQPVAGPHTAEPVTPDQGDLGPGF